MTIGINCPVCGKRLNIPADIVGKRVTCDCGTVFTARASASIEVRTDDADDPCEHLDASRGERDAWYDRLPFEIPFDMDAMRAECMTGAKTIRSMVITACVLAVVIVFLGSLIMDCNDLTPHGMAKNGLLTICVAALFGVWFGFGAGRRLTEDAAVNGVPGCVVGMAAVVLLLLVIYISALIFVGTPLPTFWKLGTFGVGFLSSLGICFYTLGAR